MASRNNLFLGVAALVVAFSMVGIPGCGGSSEPTPEQGSPADPPSADTTGALPTETPPDTVASNDAASNDTSTEDSAASTSSVAGEYLLDRDAMKAELRLQMEDSDDPTAAVGIRMMEGIIDGMEWIITLSADGTADSNMTMTGPPEIGVGTWVLDGENITITLTNEAGRVSSNRGTINGDVLEITKAMSPGQSLIMVFEKIEE